MNRREIPVDIWRQNILQNSELGSSIVVVPDIGPGDPEFRLLPDTVFDACSQFVTDYWGRDENRDVFRAMYSIKLLENNAAIINKQVIDAESTRKEIRESTGLSSRQEHNFTVEIDGNMNMLVQTRSSIAEAHEKLKQRIEEDPDFEKRFKACEEGYMELVAIVTKGESPARVLGVVGAIELLHELIGDNIRAFRLPPIN